MTKKIDSNVAIQIAKEYTAIAIEHGLIPKSNNSKTTAKYVTDFFFTIAETLEKGE